MIVGMSGLFAVRPPDGSQTLAAPPATQPAIVEGPITYYNNNCNRCHGQVDAAYPDSKNPPKGDALKKVIQEMAEGPGNAPLDDAGLAEQVKLHEAIFGGGPYVWVGLVRMTNEGIVPYETIPGTEITFATTQGDVPIDVSDHQFRLPSGRGKLVARRNGRSFERMISTTSPATRPAKTP